MVVSIEVLEKAREKLISAIDDPDTQNIIFDSGVIAGSIVDILVNNAEIIRKSVAEDVIPYNNLTQVLQSIQKYYILIMQYFVCVSSKYNILLEEMYDYTASPENQQNFSLESKKNLFRLKYMKKHWIEYKKVDSDVSDASVEFSEDIKKTASEALNESDQAAAFRACLMFAAKIHMFLDGNKGLLVSLNDFLKQQRTVDIPRLVQMSQSLIEKRQLVFTE